MDTAKDARILILEDALKRLNDIVRQRRLKLHISYNEMAKVMHQVEKYFYEIKYAYMDAQALADLEATKKIIDAGRKIREMYAQAMKSTGYKPESVKEQLVHAELKYTLRIVEGFPNRLRNFEDEPGHAVDILAVEITLINPIADSDNLKECRCTDGTRIWTIVTNIKEIIVGSKLSCAVLPPVEMMGVVSEAMFLGSEKLPDSTQLGIQLSPSASNIDQARAQVMHIIKRLK